jgi:hypothetical protein
MIGCMGGDGDTKTTETPIKIDTSIQVETHPKTLTFYLEDGEPAADAEVFVCPVETWPMSKISSYFRTRTNAKGRYSIDTVSSGLYNVIAIQYIGSKTVGVFMDSVRIKKYYDSIPADTLRPTGSIFGWIHLQPQQEGRYLTVAIPGTNLGLATDSSGKFYNSGLPAGKYDIVVTSGEPDYLPLFAKITVRSGTIDTLWDTLNPVYEGPPVVTGLKVQYDTATGVAHLSWNKLGWDKLKSYRVFRGVGQNDPKPIRTDRDTLFTDTLLRIDQESGRIIGFGDKEDILVWKVQYILATVDTAGIEGRQWGQVIIDVPSPFYIRTTIVDRIYFQGSWGRIEDNIRVGDSIRIEATFSNPTRKTTKVQWFHIGESSTLIQETILDSASLEGVASAMYRVHDVVGTEQVLIVCWDDAGKSWTDLVTLQVKERIQY